MSDNQLQNGSETKSGGDSIVKSILYACAISCMAGPMAEMLAKPVGHLFQLTVGFLWFLFYSAYLLDEVYHGMKYDAKSPCKGMDLLGWMFFMVQGCVINCSGDVSIVAGCLGLIVISVSLYKYKIHEALPDQVCRCKRWIMQNLVFLIFMLALMMSHCTLGNIKSYWLVKIKTWASPRNIMVITVLVFACLGFFYKFSKARE